MTEHIAFIDLQAQRRRLGSRLDKAIQRVLTHGMFILGPETDELEQQLATFTGAKYVVTCANGTDALHLCLMMEEISPGDAVFVPAFTFSATAEVVVLVGAVPIFVDVLPDTFNMDPVSLEAAIRDAKRQGLKPRAVIPVDLFGQPADYSSLLTVASDHGLLVVADAAQSFGASLDGKPVGTLADCTTTSFFPAKPLGCYGDGGAILVCDQERNTILRSLRAHGKGDNKYDNIRVGMNSRLDTLQAAILIEKLAVFPGEIAARQKVARRYTEALSGVVQAPAVMPGATSVWAQYTIQVANRDQIIASLKKVGIPTAVYYPLPLNRQKAYRHLPTVPGGVPVSERLANQVLSLPMHPYLAPNMQDRIVEELRKAASGV